MSSYRIMTAATAAATLLLVLLATGLPSCADAAVVDDGTIRAPAAVTGSFPAFVILPRVDPLPSTPSWGSSRLVDYDQGCRRSRHRCCGSGSSNNRFRNYHHRGRISNVPPLHAKKSKKKGGRGFGSKDDEGDNIVVPTGSDYDSTADASSPAPIRNKAGEVVGTFASDLRRPEGADEKKTDDDDDDDNLGLNAGQMALKRMRDARRSKEDEELRKLRQMRDVDDALRDDPGVAAIPEKVAMRMGRRMLPFVGVPLFGSMGAFVAFWYLATYKDMEFQPAAVATVTVALLAVGLLGITYSVLSASWDPDREGSAMGVDEFNRNVENLKEGLSRSRENALLRERMAGMPEEEIEKALRELDKRDERRAREAEGLKEKLERELK